jgi:hypothetical protein
MNNYEVKGFTRTEDATKVKVKIIEKISDGIYQKKEYLIDFPLDAGNPNNDYASIESKLSSASIEVESKVK